MTRQEEQFNIIHDGLIAHLESKQLEQLRLNYEPKFDNSDISDCDDIEDYSSEDQSEALQYAKEEFIEDLRSIFDDDNKALIMIEKILETYSGK